VSPVAVASAHSLHRETKSLAYRRF